MADELKPCPFCGGEAYHYAHGSGSGEVPPDFVACVDCGANVHITVWNTRAPLAAVPGYVVVPTVLSHDMILAAWRHVTRDLAEGELQALDALWSAMLAASPNLRSQDTPAQQRAIAGGPRWIIECERCGGESFENGPIAHREGCSQDTSSGERE